MKKTSSVAEFVKEISRNENKEKKTTTYFRGISKNYTTDYNIDKDIKEQLQDSLKPSIFRKTEWIENEDKMFKEFIIRNPNDFKEDQSTFEKLARMQHYELPTRLLDITSNALIALYFACEDYNKKSIKKCTLGGSEKCTNKQTEDGFVFMLHIKNDDIKFFDSDTVSVLSNLSRRPSGEIDEKRELYVKTNTENNILEYTEFFTQDIPRAGNTEEFNKWREKFNNLTQTKYLLHEIKDEKPYFEPIINPHCLNKVYCVKPLLNNRRIIRQDGAFLLFGMNNIKQECPIIKQEEYTTITIDGNDKTEILKELAHLGITKDKVYPEMDKVAEYLREQYS